MLSWPCLVGGECGSEPQPLRPYDRSSVAPPEHSWKTLCIRRKGMAEVDNCRDGVEAVPREEVAISVVLLHGPRVEAPARVFSVW